MLHTCVQWMDERENKDRKKDTALSRQNYIEQMDRKKHIYSSTYSVVVNIIRSRAYHNESVDLSFNLSMLIFNRFARSQLTKNAKADRRFLTLRNLTKEWNIKYDGCCSPFPFPLLLTSASIKQHKCMCIKES